MTASVPKVRVFKKNTPATSRPGMASKIAVIGAFDSEETNPIACETIDKAYELFGTDTSYKGVSAIDKLFYGASSLLIVNITTKTGSGASITVDKELTTQKLTDSLEKIKGEEFDMLFVAEDLQDTAFPIITQFLDESFGMKNPAGYVAGISRANVSAYVATANLAGDFCYGLITQQLTLKDVELSISDSAAYYCGVLASLNVGNSMTMKVIPNINGVNPELTFEVNENTGEAISDGAKMLQAGITTVKCFNRNDEKYIVVNSELPNGLDLYINRTRDYIVKEFSLHQFLGERNRTATLDEIKQELDRVKELCVNSLDLLEDIVYDVSKKSPNCVDVYINSLLFAGIITEIDVYVKIEVE